MTTRSFSKSFKAGAALSQILNTSKGSQFNLMLFGAPGVGKGTFAKLIKRDFNFQPFSTGDYFRSVIKMAQANSGELDSFTLRISEILNSGALVDD
jgi:adenylate kinase